MSYTQMSCSALERLVARRSVPLHRRSPVCRNLFGPVDHDELRREMSDRMREVSERDRQRWNFDFQSDSPLDGPYRWERVPADTSPAFYRDSASDGTTCAPVTLRPPADSSVAEVRERLSVPGSSGASCPLELNQENRTDALNAGSRAHDRCVRRKRTVSADSSALITDFFMKRKKGADRRGTDISACHLSKSPIPLEQTPRRGIR